VPKGDRIKCARKECDVIFERSTHNQKYHDEECCRLATNARIMEKYYERKARRGGVKRICETPGCQTLLSRYNASKLCSKCEGQKAEQERQNLLGLIV
jgi:hypothetical protein